MKKDVANVLQTFLYGMEDIVLNALIIQNLMKNKINATTALRVLLETTIVINVCLHYDSFIDLLIWNMNEKQIMFDIIN